MNDAFNQEVRYRLLKVLSHDASLTCRQIEKDSFKTDKKMTNQ